MTILLEMEEATREQEMWERRFKALYRAHPIWRSADNYGSWGLRDFLNYAGQVCGFAPASCDTRRMAETGNTDSVRSTGGAVGSEADETPKEYP